MLAYVDLKEDGEATKKPKDAPRILADPWSELKAPTVKLKPLPVGLRYAFQGPSSTYQVLINSNLNNAESILPLCEFRNYHKELGYSLDNIP